MLPTASSSLPTCGFRCSSMGVPTTHTTVSACRRPSGDVVARRFLPMYLRSSSFRAALHEGHLAGVRAAHRRFVDVDDGDVAILRRERHRQGQSTCPHPPRTAIFCCGFILRAYLLRDV